MSKSAISKVSSILVGFSIIVAAAYPVFAQDSINETRVTAGSKIQTTAQRINTKEIEDKIASKEAMLRIKLQSFRDQKKATAAARVSTNLTRINQNQATHMQRLLDLMSGILDKLEARVNQGTPDIKNPSAARTAIASSRATIATAIASVTAQAQKDYTIQVTFESRIGIDAKTQRDNLHTDILTIRKVVINAKQSVADAIRIARSGPISTDTRLEKEGTISGQR